jgi:hypothetical protein
MLRVPGWAEGPRCGSAAAAKPAARGLRTLRRIWKAGDRIELRLPMEPRLVAANPYVESAQPGGGDARPAGLHFESPDCRPASRSRRWRSAREP